MGKKEIKCFKGLLNYSKKKMEHLNENRKNMKQNKKTKEKSMHVKLNPTDKCSAFRSSVNTGELGLDSLLSTMILEDVQGPIIQRTPQISYLPLLPRLSFFLLSTIHNLFLMFGKIRKVSYASLFP